MSNIFTTRSHLILFLIYIYYCVYLRCSSEYLLVINIVKIHEGNEECNPMKEIPILFC